MARLFRKRIAARSGEAPERKRLQVFSGQGRRNRGRKERTQEKMKFGFSDSSCFPVMRALSFSGAVFCALSLFSCKDDPDSYPPVEERDRVQGVVFDVDFSVTWTFGVMK